MAVYSNDVQKIYIAYYGRPADAVGLAFWESQLEATGGNLSAIIGSFGASSEFDTRFGGLSDSSLISNIYQQLFGRDPDAGGLAFYLAELQAERMTLQSISIAVLNGSQNNDLNIINNKTAASTLFTSSLANGKFKYEGSAAANSASTWLAKIDETYTTEMLTTSTSVFISRPLASTTIPEMSINYDAFISQNDGSVAETVTLDFNSDGLLDVLVVSGQYLTTNGTKIEIALSNGDGTFLDGTSNIITGDIPEFLHPREIVQDDFNGDSITDFYIVGHGYDASPFPGEPNALLLSNVDGTWANSPIPTEKDFTHSATSGDIDNDGDIDIYVGNIFGGDRIPPYTLINDGVGEFTKSSSILPVTLKNLKVVFTTSLLFDANNDGWGDIVVGGNENIGNKIFLNNQGGFSDSSVINLPESTRFSTNIVVDSQTYDFNNDGILDILFLSTKGSPFYEENQIQILINDGLANFTDESDTYIPNYLQYQDIWSNYVHIVDINDDSYKDLLLGRTGTYYLNDGSGIFSTSGTIPQLKWGDYEVVNIDSDTQSEIVFQHHQAGLGVMDFM
jgi:hypothetical protein